MDHRLFHEKCLNFGVQKSKYVCVDKCVFFLWISISIIPTHIQQCSALSMLF